MPTDCDILASSMGIAVRLAIAHAPAARGVRPGRPVGGTQQIMISMIDRTMGSRPALLPAICKRFSGFAKTCQGRRVRPSFAEIGLWQCRREVTTALIIRGMSGNLCTKPASTDRIDISVKLDRNYAPPLPDKTGFCNVMRQGCCKPPWQLKPKNIVNGLQAVHWRFLAEMLGFVSWRCWTGSMTTKCQANQ